MGRGLRVPHERHGYKFMWPLPTNYRRTTSDYYLNIEDTRTCTTATSDNYDGYVTYASTGYCNEEEVLEQKRIVEYAIVWALIAYAVILRKLIEQRGRSPPLISINL